MILAVFSCVAFSLSSTFVIRVAMTGSVEPGVVELGLVADRKSTDLLSHPKIACTPHVGAATVEAQARIGTELAEAIISNFGKN